jgi:hypothetical protein
MSTTGRNSHTSRNSGNAWWTIRRQPKQPEAAEDLGLPEIAPYYPNRLRNRIILGIVLVVVVVAVAVGVVLSKNGSGDKVVSAENRTVTSNETSTPSPAPATRRPSRPSSSPTLDPTVSTESPALTNAPSLVTGIPTTTQPTVPAEQVTDNPTLPTQSVVNQFLNGLPAYSTDLAESDADSAQAKALAWLQEDPLYVEYQNVYRLNQRYALAVFYHTANRTSWLSNDNECTWYSYDYHFVGACGADSRLTMLDLHDSGWEGSIPTEVELLTDLERISLGEFDASTSFSGTIPTEM